MLVIIALTTNFQSMEDMLCRVSKTQKVKQIIAEAITPPASKRKSNPDTNHIKRMYTKGKRRRMSGEKTIKRRPKLALRGGSSKFLNSCTWYLISTLKVPQAQREWWSRGIASRIFFWTTPFFQSGNAHYFINLGWRPFLKRLENHLYPEENSYFHTF